LEQVLYDCLGFAKKYWLILQCLSTDPHWVLYLLKDILLTIFLVRYQGLFCSLLITACSTLSAKLRIGCQKFIV
jgi:hypothetical protein